MMVFNNHRPEFSGHSRGTVRRWSTGPDYSIVCEVDPCRILATPSGATVSVVDANAYSASVRAIRLRIINADTWRDMVLSGSCLT